jgi:NAD(P)H dehydrogenase (quinone)
VSGCVGNTDAAGELGGRVAERLALAGARQRLIVQDGVAAPDVPGADVASIGGYDDTDRMRRAFAGVDTLFLIPIREHPQRERLHEAAVEAALRAGVGRIVYSSFVGAAADASFTLARDHFATEQRIRSAGVSYTMLRGSAFLEVLRYIVGDDGVIRGPGGGGRFAPVARDDLAATAAAVLAADGAYDGETLEVTGPERLSLQDIAAAFAAATGREISYIDETLEDAFASRRRLGAEEWLVDAWVGTYLAIARGELDVVTDTVARVSGHAPMSLADFLEAHPENYEQMKVL